MGKCPPLVGFEFLSSTSCKPNFGDHTHLLKQSVPDKIFYFRPDLNDFYAWHALSNLMGVMEWVPDLVIGSPETCDLGN